MTTVILAIATNPKTYPVGTQDTTTKFVIKNLSGEVLFEENTNDFRAVFEGVEPGRYLGEVSKLDVKIEQEFDVPVPEETTIFVPAVLTVAFL